MELPQSRIFLRTLLLSVVSFPLSCTVDDDPDTPDTPEPTGSVQLILEDIQLPDASFSHKWQRSDKVSVNGKTFYVSANSDGTAGITVPAAKTYTAFYPAGILSGNVVYMQPVQYNGSAGTFPCTASCSHGDKARLEFNALSGFLRIKVAGSGQIASIKVRDNTGGKLCGTYSIDGTAMTSCPGLSFPEVTLNCKTASGGAASIAESGTEFLIALPPSDYSKGFTLTVSGKDGRSVEKSCLSAVRIESGKATDLPEAIGYSVPENQLYSLHFDNLVAGGDPVSGKEGFDCASYANPTGYEIYNAACDADKAGAAVMSATNVNKHFDLPETYVYSRNLQDLTEAYQCREFHGCIGCGVRGTDRAVFKLPPFSGIPVGKVCKAEINMKMAALKGVSTQDIDILPTYSTVGKILELWIDGRKVADCTPTLTVTAGSMGDGSRWSVSDNATTVTPSNFSVERVRVKASELADGNWHDVKVVMGAVASSTTIQIFSHSTSGGSCVFFLDDISVTTSDYDPPSGFNDPSWIISLNNTAMTYLKNQAKALGFKEYIDIGVGTAFFSGRNWDETKITTDLSVYAKAIEDAGFKVWNIHLPATDENDSYDTDIFEYFHSDKTLRQAAVDRTKIILRCVKVFKSVNLMVHATGKGRHSYDFETYKDFGVDSFTQLTAYCNSADMRYPDGTYPVFCIENIQNTGTERVHVNALAEYMNYYCEKVPGLKVCLDTSHSQVCMDGGESTVEYCRKLGKNLCSVHIHGNGLTTKDRHIYPGYRNGLYYSTGGNDLIDWAEFYNVLRTDCGYDGPFTYEIGSNAADCIASFSNIVHNYYTVVLEPYKARFQL